MKKEATEISIKRFSLDDRRTDRRLGYRRDRTRSYKACSGGDRGYTPGERNTRMLQRAKNGVTYALDTLANIADKIEPACRCRGEGRPRIRSRRRTVAIPGPGNTVALDPGTKTKTTNDEDQENADTSPYKRQRST